MTITEFKEIVKDWPETDINGEETEVWLQNKDNTSRPLKTVTPLNWRLGDKGTWLGDMILD